MAETASRRAKVKKGDQVIVMAGRDRGKRGRVLEVRPREGRVRVEGVAVIKRHQKANPSMNRGGGILEKEALINISNVQLVDPSTGKPTRVRYDVAGDRTKTRVASGSGQALDKE
ncbi:MAG TPA: 50S ribosomal protein L24 [Pyrinomonadaceae bacterium]|jgi:large subunit ribosomal protein L24|nr:50S ribosomal protein L24 [Pyrinomonadaceae bacterium]